MPSPTIVPLLITGIMIGLVLRTTKADVSWKFIIVGSLLGGLGNVANAVLLYLFQGPGTTQTTPQGIPQAVPQATPRAFAASQIAAQSLTSFLVISFIIGALMILLVFVVARLTMRTRGRKIVEEEQQQSSD
jgi:predicted neutral ceramidase superfamily lipid hydrolase